MAERAIGEGDHGQEIGGGDSIAVPGQFQALRAAEILGMNLGELGADMATIRDKADLLKQALFEQTLSCLLYHVDSPVLPGEDGEPTAIIQLVAELGMTADVRESMVGAAYELSHAVPLDGYTDEEAATQRSRAVDISTLIDIAGTTART